MRALAKLREFLPQRFRGDQAIVPVVRLTGIIGFSSPLRPGLTLTGIARMLDRVFAIRNAAAVALAINSPGGSPVQSHLIFRRIRELAKEKNVRVIAFVEDAAASGDMFYDEDAQKKRDRMSQVLGVPVSDFELSVRSRNCLKKMNIRTLGDLTRINEQQLLSSKNFGETSLLEIKDILATKGLRLGQSLEEGATFERRFSNQQPLSDQEQAVLSKSVSELNLSVRARKCMNRLGINTLGDLIQRTADELLESKNFGMTSLTEVREKLRQFGLTLRGD